MIENSCKKAAWYRNDSINAKTENDKERYYKDIKEADIMDSKIEWAKK